MARTRSTKASAKKDSTPEPEPTQSTAKPLPTPTSNPPQVFILPKNASPSARILTLHNPATANPSRYLFCPSTGFYEFTRIAAPKKSPKSWLITSSTHSSSTENENVLGTGYITSAPALFLATPIDTLFLILPALAPKTNKKDTKQHFLALDDYLDALYTTSPHLRPLVSAHPSLRIKIAKRLAAVCDTVDAGDEIMYRISHPKLLSELVKKATRMTQFFPASMEDKFIKPALDVPVMAIKREESSISIVAKKSAGLEGNTETETSEVTVESQTTTTTTTTTTAVDSQSTTVTTPDEPIQTIATPPSIPPLLRLRTSLTYITRSYLPPTLLSPIHSLLASKTPPSSPNLNLPDFTPLDAHLAQIAKLKAEALALRSISDNISRKRGYEDDDEKVAEREEKKRKKEEEEKKKKSESRGVKALKKVDTSGMKKLSSFFAPKAEVKK